MAKCWQIEPMTSFKNGTYGAVPRDLITVPSDSVQCSPLLPGSVLLDTWAAGSSSGLIVHAPPSTIERRAVLAYALRALAPEASLTAFAANTKGGTRIADELEAFGCTVEASHKRRHQIIATTRPVVLTGIDDAIAAAAPRLLPNLALWSQPGLFNWDRIDPGSKLLLDHLPALSGRGADLGCGIGVLARAVRQKSTPPQITLIDIDRRALDMARRNVPGDGVDTLWADVRTARDLPTGLDFVVTNPPFHDAGEEDKALGQAFITQSVRMLKPGGTLWLTANRHLPYEATLRTHFESVDSIAQVDGFKIYAAKTAVRTAHASTGKVRK